MSNRNIFVFFDGTDCTLKTNSNIAQLKKLIKCDYGSGIEGKHPYKTGSGTHYADKLMQNVARITGRDAPDILSKMIKDLEGLNVVSSDNLFIFGYSRGAIAARALAQFLTDIEARRQYSELVGKPLTLSSKVKFLGLFDPVKGQPNLAKRYTEIGNSVALNSKIEAYVEILAIDDKRLMFKNSVISKKTAKPKSSSSTVGVALLSDSTGNVTVIPKNRAYIWMPGKHADIGGQKGHDFISKHTLLTMLECLAKFCESEVHFCRFETAKLNTIFDRVQAMDNMRISSDLTIKPQEPTAIFGRTRREISDRKTSELHCLADEFVSSGRREGWFRRNKSYSLTSTFSNLPRFENAYPKLKKIIGRN